VTERPKGGGAVGAVVGATYRLMAAPVRAVAAHGDVPRRLQDAAVDAVTTPAAERTLDELFAGPFPELVGRALAEHKVVQRVAAEALAHTEVTEELRRALESERTQQAVQELLASDAFRQLLDRAFSSPELRRALAEESSTVALEAADAVRRRAALADTRAERAPRRLFRRPARAATPTAYGGIVSRALALAIDALVVSVLFAVGAGLVGLVSSLVGHLRPQWLVGTLAGSGWLILLTVYFVGFWTTVGQTPGMRLLGVRVLARGAPPRLGRSLVRLVGLLLAIAPCFLGFVPALLDERRRGLHDFLAGTAVVYDDR